MLAKFCPVKYFNLGKYFRYTHYFHIGFAIAIVNAADILYCDIPKIMEYRNSQTHRLSVLDIMRFAYVYMIFPIGWTTLCWPLLPIVDPFMVTHRKHFGYFYEKWKSS